MMPTRLAPVAPVLLHCRFELLRSMCRGALTRGFLVGAWVSAAVSRPSTIETVSACTISSLRIDDTVLAYDPATGKAEPELVQHVWVNHDSDLVDVDLQSSASTSSGPAATPTSTSAASAPSRGKELLAASLALAAALAISGHANAPTSHAAHTATNTTTTATATTETIHTTANHSRLTADRGWVAACELRAGEQMVTRQDPGRGRRRQLRGCPVAQGRHEYRYAAAS